MLNTKTTAMKKEELYDRICKTLTDYEHPEEATLPVSIEDMYDLLVDIQNSWDDLTSSED